MSANDQQVAGEHYKTPVQEVWRSIPGWEGRYEASQDGRIRSVARLVERAHSKNAKRIQKRIYGGKILSPKIGTSGYPAVNLWRNKKGTSIEVHRLVCAAFTGEMRTGMDVNHINGCRSDNRAENLEWLTRKQNLHYSEKVLGRKMVWNYQRERALVRRLSI